MRRLKANELGRLRGLNRAGLEFGAPPFSLEPLVSWGANVVRLPLNQQFALADPAYLDKVAALVARAESLDCRVILDLHWLAFEDEPRRLAELTDDDSPRFWQTLARRFAEAPNVLFDLFNEPHPRDPSDWRRRALHLVQTIRAHAPEVPLVVSASDWARDLGRARLTDAPGRLVENVCYSAHIYPRYDKRNPHATFDADLELRWWRARIERFEEPLFAAEWGPHDDVVGVERGDWRRFCDGIAALLDARGIGWCAWDWTCDPKLTDGGAVTAWGALVRDKLNAP
jgi:hypothetical protein